MHAGLVEEEWLCTLGTVEPSQLEYSDFVTVGRLLGKQLREQGAEVVIALTHMRVRDCQSLSFLGPGACMCMPLLEQTRRP
jgi:5'-nucleotidase